MPSGDGDGRSEQDHGEQSRQSVGLALEESGDDSFVVVAAVETVCTSATARMLSRVPRRTTPSRSRTKTLTMSKVTRAVASNSGVKSPMKCSGMWMSAKGIAVRTAAIGRLCRRSSRVWTKPAYAVSSPG